MRSSGFEISVKVHDTTVSYNDIGPSDAMVIIFIHGFPFNKIMWNEQLKFFSSKYRCIAYDLKGFGHSIGDLDDLSIEGFADDLNDFMEILQINKALICGLSMGGYIVLQTFKKYHNRFLGLILCDTQCYGDSPETKEKRIKSIEKIKNNDKEEFAVDFIKKAFSEETIMKKTELVGETIKTIINTVDSTLIKTLKALAEREDMCSVLKNIDIPGLIICGELDKVTPLKFSEYLHCHIKNSELEIIKDAGHLTNLEKPVIFNNMIHKFIEKRY